MPAKYPVVVRHNLEMYRKLIISNQQGGVWLTNTYPGVRCDIPADIYQSTFAPSDTWSSNYPPGSEIQEYWKALSKRYNVDRYISFNTSVRQAKWLPDQGQWELHVVETQSHPEGTCGSKASTQYADILITATGIFSKAHMPDVPGPADFQGHMQHSASWDPESDLANKSVALIGNGASGLQLLPELQKHARQIHHYIRSPTWISPSFGGEDVPTHARHAPTSAIEYTHYRATMESKTYARFSMLIKDTKQSNDAKKTMRALMERRLGPAADALLESLLPDFAPNCRRLTPTPGYLEALASPNVELVTSPIDRFTVDGIRTADGTQRIHDAVVCATGFDASFAPSFSIINGVGSDLQSEWAQNEASSYLGMAAPRFPNLFFLLGPNSTGQPGPLVHIIETQLVYVAKVLRKMITQGIKTIMPSEAATDDFKAYCDAFFPSTVMSDGCRSWYNGGVPQGRIRVSSQVTDS